MLIELGLAAVNLLLGFFIGYKTLQYINDRLYKKTIESLRSKGYEVAEGVNKDTGNSNLTIKYVEPKTTQPSILSLNKKPVLH